MHSKLTTLTCQNPMIKKIYTLIGGRFFFRRRGCSKPATGALKNSCESNQIGVNDIDYAIRYTQQNENLDFGFLGASEADEQFSQGKDFYAFRTRKNGDNYSLGYLGTYTERPVLDRQATVHSVDLTYRPTEKLRIDTVLVNSNVELPFINPLLGS